MTYDVVVVGGGAAGCGSLKRAASKSDGGISLLALVSRPALTAPRAVSPDQPYTAASTRAAAPRSARSARPAA